MSGATVQVGNVEIPGRVFLAPLAGFTDLPFRQICRKLGAAYAVAEMVASQKHLRESRKSQERFSLGSESYPRAIQLLGSDPVDLADTARYAVQCGAQIVDFNCGCPAKKVCSVECGSALLKDEALVEKLLKALTEAVDVPVTLKYRLGWDVTFKLAAPDGYEYLPPTTLSARRDLPYTIRNYLSRETEEATLYRDIERDIVVQLMRRIEAAKAKAHAAAK